MLDFVINVRIYDECDSLVAEPISGLLLRDWCDQVLPLLDSLCEEAVMHVYDPACRKDWILRRSMSESERKILEYAYL